MVSPVFGKASRFAGLELNPKKCITIPTNFDDLDANTLEIREWLLAHLPQWKEFKIEAAHAYLGPLVGPKAAESSWDKAINTYWDRVCLIAGSGLSSY